MTAIARRTFSQHSIKIWQHELMHVILIESVAKRYVNYCFCIIFSGCIYFKLLSSRIDDILTSEVKFQ